MLLTASGIVALIHPENTFVGFADILGFVFLMLGIIWTVEAIAERVFNDLWWLTAASLMVGLAFWVSGQFFLTRAATLLVFADIWALVKGTNRYRAGVPNPSARLELTVLERRIDMAEVNGRPFLNNISLGVYGDAVQRSGYRDAKSQTMLDTLHEVLSSTTPTPELLLTDDLARRHTSPLVVLVSNNEYALDQPLAQGSRPRLDTGRLGIIVLDRPGAKRPPVSAWSAPSIDIAATAPLPAGLDGEAVTVLPPLHFTTRPAALRVRISRHHPGASPSALLSSR